MTSESDKLVLNLAGRPLCNFFLSGYLSSKRDGENFPAEQGVSVLDRYEELFGSALRILGVPKERLRGRSEFNFDSGDPGNLESGVAVLRVVVALQQQKFESIALAGSGKGSAGADLTCTKNAQRVCCEIKAITKQSRGRRGLFFEDQLYEKILENISKARKQLAASSAHLGCNLGILVCVVNWFAQSIYLDQRRLPIRC